MLVSFEAFSVDYDGIRLDPSVFSRLLIKSEKWIKLLFYLFLYKDAYLILSVRRLRGINYESETSQSRVVNVGFDYIS
jgi:hypothetical protein